MKRQCGGRGELEKKRGEVFFSTEGEGKGARWVDKLVVLHCPHDTRGEDRLEAGSM